MTKMDDVREILSYLAEKYPERVNSNEMKKFDDSTVKMLAAHRGFGRILNVTRRGDGQIYYWLAKEGFMLLSGLNISKDVKMFNRSSTILSIMMIILAISNIFLIYFQLSLI